MNELTSIAQKCSPTCLRKLQNTEIVSLYSSKRNSTTGIQLSYVANVVKIQKAFTLCVMD